MNLKRKKQLSLLRKHFDLDSEGAKTALSLINNMLEEEDDDSKKKSSKSKKAKPAKEKEKVKVSKKKSKASSKAGKSSEYDNMSLGALAKECKAYGITTEGAEDKEDYIQRLVLWDETFEEMEGLSIKELSNRLIKLHLDTASVFGKTKKDDKKLELAVTAIVNDKLTE